LLYLLKLLSIHQLQHLVTLPVVFTLQEVHIIDLELPNDDEDNLSQEVNRLLPVVFDPDLRPQDSLLQVELFFL